jgi:hypothetical protein
MGLFWLVHEIDGARVVRIQEGGAMLFARLNAMIDGFGGKFVEAHPLDDKTAKRIQKRMTGRTFKADEAAKVLDRLA